MGKMTSIAMARAADAQKQPGQVVRLVDLGDGVGFAGFEIAPLFRAESTEEGAPMVMVAGLFGVGGRQSTLSLNVELRRILIAELATIPVEVLKQALTESPTADTQPVEVPPASDA